jgi:tRNA (guanine-N(7)-)-methyltransferase subunit TRM82
LLSTWKCPSTIESIGRDAGQEVNEKLTGSNVVSPTLPVDISSTSPPAKRRKLSNAGDTKPSGEEGKGKKKSNNRSESVVSGLDAPAIIALTVTQDSQHVIAVSGEDKSIRVFERTIEDGKEYLKSVSQR